MYSASRNWRALFFQLVYSEESAQLVAILSQFTIKSFILLVLCLYIFALLCCAVKPLLKKEDEWQVLLEGYTQLRVASGHDWI